MRKKASCALIGYFVIFAGIVWIAGKIGWGWLLAIILLGVIGWAAMTFTKDKSPSASPDHSPDDLPDMRHDEFGPQFDSPQQASTYYGQLMRTDPDKFMRLRTQQILRESLQIALTSKKRDTAESRMETAKEKFEELQKEHSIPRSEWNKIQERFLKDRKVFSTVKYINQARGLLGHGSKLKTEKSRKKYLDMAKDVIDEGLRDPSSDKDRLTTFLKDIGDGVPQLNSSKE